MQLGLGTEAGPETMALIARAAYNAGIPILSDDCVNGFNAAKRQSMLDAIYAMWPEATALFNTFYSQHSPVFYSYSGEDGSRCIRIILSKEGSRMGCTFGSMAFDILVHHFVYKPLSLEFPKVSIKALTDDMPSLHPFQGSNDDDWQSHYLNIWKFRQRHIELLKPIGLSLHPEKTLLLLPPHAPPPNLQDGMSLPFTYDGGTLAGAFIGTPNFVASNLRDKFDTYIKRLKKICTLAPVDPQLTMQILTLCAALATNYLQRVMSTNVIIPFCQIYDEAMHDARKQCMLVKGQTAPAHSQERESRSRLLQTLPFCYGGAGHTPSTLSAPFAAIAALTVARSDPLLSTLITHLTDDIHFSYDQATSALRLDEIAPNHPLTKLIPASAAELIDNRSERSLTLGRKCKLQAFAMPLVMYNLRNDLRNTCAHAITSNTFTDGLTIEDATHILAVTSRSQSSRVFIANTWFKHNRLDPSTFVAFTRFHFNLPQLIHGNTCNLLDTSVRTCSLPHDQPGLLDPTGSHAASCISSYGSRVRTHNEIRDLITRMAKEVGFEAAAEPPTEDVLLGEFTRQQVKLLFPKKKSSESLKVIREYNDCRQRLAAGNLSNDEIHVLNAHLDELLEGPKPDAKCITLDVMIEHPDLKQPLWIDVARIHTTAKSRIKETAAWFTEEAKAELLSYNTGAPNPFKKMASKHVTKYAELKYNHYSTLTELANRQMRKGMRHTIPKLLAGIITHTGEFSDDIFALIEALAKKAKDNAAANPSIDGIPPSRVAAEIRTRAKDALAIINAKGVGRALIEAGLPRSGLPPKHTVDSQDVSY